MKAFLGLFICGLLVSFAAAGFFSEGGLLSGAKNILSGAANKLTGLGGGVINSVTSVGILETAFKGVGKVIGFTWGCVVPGTVNKAAIEAAGGDANKVETCSPEKLLAWQKKYPGKPLPS